MDIIEFFFAMDKSKNTTNQLVSKILLSLILGFGLLLITIASHDLITEARISNRFFYTFSLQNQSLIILLIGILLLILGGMAWYLIRLSSEHIHLMNALNRNFNEEENKKKLEIALLEGQKLQAIGTLAGGIAHDFNNILYAIIGYVEMAREDVEQDTLLFKNLGKVLEASHRGQELVARILDFGRRNQRYEQKPIQINTLIENVLSLLRPTIPSSVRIELVNPYNSLILGNETQLHQVIVNIINNAVDAMYGEGTVTIEVKKISSNDPILKQFPKLSLKNYCTISISDTGHGMDQTTLKRIFEPFYTTKEVGKGTGLGLATVHGIIAQHHGEVMVTSQLGIGTTFTLLLPEHYETSLEKEDIHGNYSFSGR
jgi:signal transduction histidine kinase